jgi:hypothetical protein
MSLTDIVSKAERRGESLFESDPTLSTDLRKADVVGDLEHARCHIRSAIAKIEDYPYQDKAVRAEIIEYLSKDLKRLGQSIVKYRRAH